MSGRRAMRLAFIWLLLVSDRVLQKIQSVGILLVAPILIYAIARDLILL
jgi:hypothetical protein